MSELLLIFAATLAMMGLAMMGLGLGLFLSKKPLAGSCGGLACGRACLRGAPCPTKAAQPES